MGNKIVNENTLIFKISEKGDISNLEFDNDILNFIADMSDVHLDLIELIKNNLVIFGKSIYENKGSFVIVCSHSFDEELNIVPTVQEAFDLIEMEEIERQLDF